ncbi:MAG: protein kinase [Verrucomicrobiales bacterium]|nr:protein kinase [Verrucomicrobiales bacterium]
MQNQPSFSCSNCGAVLPPNAPQGLCPRCLLSGAAEPTRQTIPGSSPLRPPAPTVVEVAAAFPQWEILELLGQGGMGAVYKVRQPNLDRMVALKLLPAALAEIPGFSERFAREAKLLARLNHPNIVSVHDFGQGGGFFFLLMEYVDGVNLRQAMQAGKFSCRQALQVIQHVCEALQYAHDEGVVHRDIKPENILLDTRGRVKLADFGIGKLAGDLTRTAPNLTVSGAALGTPQYMAPEQIERPQDVDHRADIYSLGVVFYELLTGELPLGRFAAPSQKTAVSAGVDEVVFRALEKERERRQQSAAQMKTEVQCVAQGRSATPAASGQRSRRHVVAVVFLLLALLALGTSLGVAKYQQGASIAVLNEMNEAHRKLDEAKAAVAAVADELRQARSASPADVSIADLQITQLHRKEAEAEAAARVGDAERRYAEMSEPPAGWFSVLGTAGFLLLLATVFGWSALGELRRRHQEEGRIAAMFAAWLVPAVLLAAGIGWVILELLTGFIWKNRDLVGAAGKALVGVLWLMLAVWLIRGTWRGLTHANPNLPRRHGFMIVCGLISLGLLAIILANLRSENPQSISQASPHPAVPAAVPRSHAEFKVLSVKATSPAADVGTGTIAVEFEAIVPPGHRMEPFTNDTSGLVGVVETKESPSVTSSLRITDSSSGTTEERLRGQVVWTIGNTGRPIWASPTGSSSGKAHFGAFIGPYRADLAEAEIRTRGAATTLNRFEEKPLWSAGVFAPDLEKLRTFEGSDSTPGVDLFTRRGELTIGLQLRPTPTLK